MNSEANQLDALPTSVADLIAEYAAKNRITVDEAIEWASEGRVWSDTIGSGVVISAVSAMTKQAPTPQPVDVLDAQKNARTITAILAKMDIARAKFVDVQERAQACGVASGRDTQDIDLRTAAQEAADAEELMTDAVNKLCRIRDRALTLNEVEEAKAIAEKHAAICEVCLDRWTTLLKWRMEAKRIWR